MHKTRQIIFFSIKSVQLCYECVEHKDYPTNKHLKRTLFIYFKKVIRDYPLYMILALFYYSIKPFIQFTHIKIHKAHRTRDVNKSVIHLLIMNGLTVLQVLYI